MVDRNNDRVQVFSPSGSGADYLTQFGAAVLDEPSGIAIDQDSGSVYVSDADDVVKFDSDGASTPAFAQDGGFASPGVTGPLAFDQAADQLLVADVAASLVRRYSEAGVAGAPFDGSASGAAFTALEDLASDDAGDVLVVDADRAMRFAADGSHEATFAGLPATADRIAAVPGSGEVLIAHNGLFSERAYVVSDGEVVHTINPGGAVGGLASSGAPGRIYATTHPDELFGFGSTGVHVTEVFTIQPPVVETIGASPTERGAQLRGSVDPNRDATAWQFEYGETASYGSTFPVDPVDLPAGNAPVALQRTIGGLEPDTTYHYRLVATNAAGTSEGSDRTFTTSAVTQPPDPAQRPRVYEQISRTDKNGVPIELRVPVLATPSGERVAYSINGAWPGDPTSVLYSYQVSRRSPEAWTSRSADVPGSAPGNWADTLIGQSTVIGLSSDLDRSLASSHEALAPGAIGGGTNLYSKDTGTGSLRLEYATPDPALHDKLIFNFSRYMQGRIATSDDLSHLLVSTSVPLTPDAAPATRNVFDISGGEAQVVGMVDGAVPATGSDNSMGGFDPELLLPTYLSADGRRVFFSADVGTHSWGSGPLYVREDGGEAVPLSLSQRTGEEGTLYPAKFVAASADGSIVYFRSEAFLTDDANGFPEGDHVRLYRYERDSGELTNLAHVQEPWTDLGALDHVYAVTRDGAAIFFTFNGPVADGPNPPGEMPTGFYIADDQGTRYIGQVDNNPMSLSPSGRFLAFESRAANTGYDNPDERCGGPCTEVFVYDRWTHATRCASCHSEGDNGHSRIFPSGTSQVKRFSRQPLRMLDDGRLLFESDEALIAGDVNHRRDVYEWAWETQATSLVTPGTGPYDASVAEVTPDGRSVFFGTTERLVRQDRDDLLDLYVARAGGGISAQDMAPGSGTGCDGDACQGMPSSRPGLAIPGTDGDGRESDAAARRPEFSGGVPTARQRAALVAGRAVTVRVKVDRPGRVSVAGRARIGGRTVTVLSAARRAARAGTVALRLRLSPAARRALGRGRPLRVSVSVRFAGGASKRSLTLRRSAGASRPSGGVAGTGR